MLFSLCRFRYFDLIFFCLSKRKRSEALARVRLAGECLISQKAGVPGSPDSIVHYIIDNNIKKVTYKRIGLPVPLEEHRRIKEKVHWHILHPFLRQQSIKADCMGTKVRVKKIITHRLQMPKIRRQE